MPTSDICVIIAYTRIHTAGEGVNSTTFQCIHEQNLTGICIFPVFHLFPMDPMYKSLTQTKHTQSLKRMKF